AACCKQPVILYHGIPGSPAGAVTARYGLPEAGGVGGRHVSGAGSGDDRSGVAWISVLVAGAGGASRENGQCGHGVVLETAVFSVSPVEGGPRSSGIRPPGRNRRARMVR